MTNPVGRFLQRWTWLIVFFVVWPAIGYTLLQGEQSYASWTYPPLLGFCYAMLALIAIWCGLSKTRWWLRVPLAIAAMAGLTYAVLYLLDFRETPGNEFFFAYPTISVFLLAWLVRQFIGPVDRASTLESETPKARLQFSLGQAMLWTAFAAAFITLAKPRVSAYREMGQFWSYTYMSTASLTCSSLALIPLLVRSRFLLPSVPLVWLLSVGASLGGGFAIHSQLTQEAAWHFGSIGGTQAFVTCTTVLLFRWAVNAPATSSNLDSQVTQVVPEAQEQQNNNG